MSMTQEEKDYLHETFMSVKECNACRDKIQRELSAGSTNFAEIQKDLQYIKDRIDKKSRFNSATASSIIQAVCTLLVAIIAARMGIS